jgi:hypothetical protein
VKLSKNIVPCTIASAAAARVTHEVHGSKNVSDASGSKAGGGGQSSKIVAGAKGYHVH